MRRKKRIKIDIPLTVPRKKRREYARNFRIATRGTGRLFMFACDQKVEHLNQDFMGKKVTEEMADPEHFFRIGSRAHVGVMATQLGLIARYAGDYPKVPYIVKLNSKTNILKTADKDPIARLWNTMDEVMEFKRQNRVPIVGVGYTIYIGSWYESEMFREAAQLIHKAHQNGLLTILWIYPRGKAVKSEMDADIIAGGAGIAACLGADFVKLHSPAGKGKNVLEGLHRAVIAAGPALSVSEVRRKTQSSFSRMSTTRSILPEPAGRPSEGISSSIRSMRP